jgi:hypothetical protein
MAATENALKPSVYDFLRNAVFGGEIPQKNGFFPGRKTAHNELCRFFAAGVLSTRPIPVFFPQGKNPYFKHW